jgi:amino acid transporter
MKKLSLPSLILISLNIMLGAGVFINTAVLAQQTGSLSPLVYAIVGLLLFPLILGIIQLWKFSEHGCTFYDFGSHLSPFFGFISSWSFFLGKICSFTLGIHVCMSLIQTIIPILKLFPTIMLDIITVTACTMLNLLNLKAGSRIQYGFLILKLIPILFVILMGFYFFTGSYIYQNIPAYSSIPATMPFVLYAYSGFESSCSLSGSIENPGKNGPRAIMLSYLLVIILLVLFQFMFYASLGPALGQVKGGYLGVFPLLVEKLNVQGYLKKILVDIFHIGIASSSLGSSYGIMFSNSWNLFVIAKNDHTFIKKLLMKLNESQVPYFCVISQALMSFLYLFITKGNQIPLQQTGALGMSIAYTICSLSLLAVLYKREKKIKLLPIFSLISCLLLIFSFVWNVWSLGISNLLVFFAIAMLLGTYMFYLKHEPKEMKVYEEL